MVKGFICKLTCNICTLSAVLVGSVVSSNAASALASQSETDFQFTFNSSITLTLSSSDLVISHITPGNYANSNTISVDVSTNNRTGYTLVAKVGDKNSSTLNNNNLVNTANDANFTSLATTDNKALANFDDGKWGYTVAPTIASATTYSGLLYNADTVINATRNVAGDPQEGYLGSNSTSFTIGAKAGQTQASGEYTNVINFRGVANVVPDIVMQETNLSELATVMPNTGDTATLVDNRDGSRYTIGKLADGKYWMLENLALDPATLKSGVTLDSSNTHLSAGKTFTLPASTTTGFTTDSTSYINPAINTASKDTDAILAVDQSGTGKIGVYYNYCAATAGTYCSGKTHTDTNNATNDICPKGWRLPTGGASGEFQALRDEYSSDAEFVVALRTPLSGDFYDGQAIQQGSNGYFWSSTYSSATLMYTLRVGTSGVNPQDTNNRLGGFSVRCVFGSIMQNVTTSDLAVLMPNTGDTTMLMDSRDGTEYAISKLADDNYWMLDNLALGSDTAMTLTNADTNMTAESWILPASTTTGFEDAVASYTTKAINTESENTSQSLAVGQSGTGKIGVYYNYCAATAGTYCSGKTHTDTNNATNDICPKGWRLPTGGASGEFQALRDEYSSDAEFVVALRTPLSGDFYDGQAIHQGSSGYFWSSTYSSATNMYRLYVNASGVGPQSTGNRLGGFSVRCVKQ